MYYIIFILALFSSVGFFNYHGVLSDQMQRALFYAMSCGALLLAVTDRNNRLQEFDYPRYSYWTVIVSLFVSILMVNIYHGQPLAVSLIATLPYIFAYLYLYVLVKFRMPADALIKILMGVSILGIPVYFCNLLSFPEQVFGLENEEGADFSRGMLRVAIPFFEAMLIIFFYAIQQWKETARKIWLICIVAGIVMIILSLTRQIIVVALGLALLYFVKDLSVVKKLAIITICVVVGIVAMNKVPIFKTMIELSETQAELNDDKEDVRVRAWRYYTYENQEDVETMLLGNGVPALGISAYGIVFQQDIEETHCLLVDVGWAGFFYLFGLCGTIALFVMLCQSVRAAYCNGRSYMVYWLIFIMITSVASGPILFYYQIIIVMTGVYLAYVPNEENGSYNTELQQC